MAGETQTTLQPILREVWPQDQIFDELNFGMPGWALMRKEDDLSVLDHLAVGYGTSQGISNSFSDAKGNKQPSSLAPFKVPPGQIYSFESVDRQVIRLSRGNKYAIIKALDRAAQQAILGWKFEASTQLWGNGGAAIGQVKSINGNQLTLTSVDDVVKFDQNMTIQAAPDDGTAATGGPTAVLGGSGIIGKVSRNISSTWHLQTKSGNWTDPTNIPGLVVNSYLFRGGNYNQGLLGIGGWLPSIDPTVGDSWCSEDRSSDPLRLAGIRVDATQLTPRQAAMRMVREALRNSADPTHYFLNPTNFESLQFELQSAGVLVMVKQTPAPIGSHSFGEPVEGISFRGAGGGEVKVFADGRVPTTYGFGLELDTFYISTAGEVPSIVADDGLTIMREEWSDSFELRVIGDLQVKCLAPGRNVRVLNLT